MTTPNPDGPSHRQPALAPTAAELREIAKDHRYFAGLYGEGGRFKAAHEEEISAWACERCAVEIEAREVTQEDIDRAKQILKP